MGKTPASSIDVAAQCPPHALLVSKSAGPSATCPPLPTELLREIFLFALARVKISRPAWPARTRRTRLPFRVAAVSRLWRCTALDTSYLWSDIVVDMCAFKSATRQLSYLELLLLRSKNCPLDIAVYYVRAGVATKVQNIFESGLFRCLSHVAYRWRSLRMSLPTRCITAAHLEIFMRRTPILEDLRLDFNVSQNINRSRWSLLNRYLFDIADYLPFCPNLRTLILRRTGYAPIFPSTLRHDILPCLVELDLDTALLARPRVLLSLLRRGPNLVKLQFGSMPYLAESIPPESPISSCELLSGLQKLKISAMPPSWLAALLPSLNLRTVEVLDLTDLDDTALGFVLPLVSDTTTTLSIRLSDDLWDDTPLFPLATALSHIRDLTLRCFELYLLPVEAFRAMREGTLWPVLEVLRLQITCGEYDGYDEFVEDDSQALLDLVISRNAPRQRTGYAEGQLPATRLVRLVLYGYKVSPAILTTIKTLVSVEQYSCDDLV